MMRCGGWMWIVVLLLGQGMALADDGPTARSRLVLGRHFAPYHWNGVSVAVTNPGAPFDGVLWLEVIPRDFLGRETAENTATYSLAVTCPTGVSNHLMAVRLPLEVSSVTTRLTDSSGREVSAAKRSIADLEMVTRVIILVVTHRAEAISALKDAAGTAVFMTPGAAPDDSRVLDAVDQIVLDDIALRELSAGARRAILEWTGYGGTLLLTGPFLQRNATDPELGHFANVQITPRRLRTGADEVARVFQRSGVAANAAAEVLDCRPLPAELTAAAGGHAVVFESPLGRGLVRGVATDPAWLGLRDARLTLGFSRYFWAKLLRDSRPLAMTQYRYVPLSLLSREGRTVEMLTPVTWYLIVFVIVAGPLNYLLLTLLRRKEWLVFTAPAAVIVFLLVAAVMGRVLHVREPELACATTTIARANSPGLFVARRQGVHAPVQGTYNLQLARPDSAPQEYVDPNATGQPTPAVHYAFSPARPVTVQGLVVPQWSMRSYADSDYRPDGAVAGRLTIGPEGLSGFVENRLPVDLQDCYLIHRWNHVAVGDLARGQRRVISLKLGPPALSEYELSRVSALEDIEGWLSQALWTEKLKGPRWDLVRELEGIKGANLRQPLLIGWGKSVAPLPALDRSSYRRFGEHLFVIALPVAAAGPRVVIPPGGAIPGSLDAFSGWSLYWPLEQNEPDAMRIGRTRCDFLLPTGQARLRHRKLEVSGYLTYEPAEDGNGAQVSLWDWRAEEWVRVAKSVPRSFKVPIERPGRFIQMPRGLVRMSLQPPGEVDNYPSRVETTWLDVTYEGDVTPQ